MAKIKDLKRIAKKHHTDIRTVKLLAGIGVTQDYRPSQTNARKYYPVPSARRKERSIRDFDII